MSDNDDNNSNGCNGGNSNNNSNSNSNTKKDNLLSITEQDRRVYTLLAKVPKGKVTTYGELAKAAGIKNGQRVIGKIMNKNPYPSIIPCHRVVRSTGQIGGYAYGTDVKNNMLTKEGVTITDEKIINMDNITYRFN